MLLANQEFKVELSPDLILTDEMYTINDFSVGYKYGSMYVKKNITGDKLTKELLTTIGGLRPGQELDFQFYIKSEGDLIQSLPSVKVIVY